MSETEDNNKRRKTVNGPSTRSKISKTDVQRAFEFLQKNMDPCMQTKWRRESWPVRPLEILEQYEVAKDSGDESDGEILRSALQSSVHQTDQDLMKVISSLPVHSTIYLSSFPPRCRLGTDVQEQCVWGLDSFTKTLLFDCLSLCPELMKTAENETAMHEVRKHFIEKYILPALNQLEENGWDMFAAVERIRDQSTDHVIQSTALRLLQIMQCLELSEWTAKPLTSELKSKLVGVTDNFRSHPKGQGVICLREEGIPSGTFVEEYLGEVYTPWRWFERQDVIKKRNPDGHLPDFYNIQIERPKDDSLGFGVIFVEAADRGNFASRLCHSCQPNCRMLSLCAEGRITNAIFTVRHVAQGEELTWDYSCVTESEKEYRSAICLCGTSPCRGSFLYYAHSSAFQDILSAKHHFLHRMAILLRACHEPILEEDLHRIGRHGIKSFVLQYDLNPESLIPEWLMKWISLVLEFIEYERVELPKILLKNSAKYTRTTAEIEANGVSSNRLQNLVITVDKIKHFLTKQDYTGPPLRFLTDQEVLEFLWTDENSVVKQAVKVLKEYLVKLDRNEQAFRRRRNHRESEDSDLQDFEQFAEFVQFYKNFSPRSSEEARDGLRKLGRILKNLNSVHLALHDVLFLKAGTKFYFKAMKYNGLTSPKVMVSAADILSASPRETSGKKKSKKQEVNAKNYGPEFLWGQLIGWFKQTVYNPASSLSAERRGTVSLPSIENCYSQPVINGLYESKQRLQMLKSIERRPESQWPTGTIWSFKNIERIYGTPMLDGFIEGSKNLPEAGESFKELISELKRSQTVTS